jgi:hypothetical protein
MNMHEHDAISKIFKVALLIFATTFGIGLYALIGAPVLRINYGTYAEKITTKIASVGESALKAVPLPRSIPKKGTINYKLTTAANDFPSLKSLITNSDFEGHSTREVVFRKDNEVISGGVLFSHLTGSELPSSLSRLLLDQRYFVKRDDAVHGMLFISTPDNDATYAAVLQNEALLAPSIMHLTHPTMSISEVRMLSKIRFTSRSVGDFDVRAITTSSDEPILIWGLKENLLIIAGSAEDFITATNNDHI